MKALFIRCYGKLTADMMIGGLIDMGVPPVYLKSKLKDAGLPDNFIEKPNPKAQISAHYFHIPPYGDKPLLLKQADLFRIWKDICSKGAPDFPLPLPGMSGLSGGGNPLYLSLYHFQRENGERKIIGCHFDRCCFHSGERGAGRGCGSFCSSHAGRSFGCLHAHGWQVPYGPHCLWQFQR